MSRFADAGVLAPDPAGSHPHADVARVRLVSGLIESGLDLDTLAAAVADGRLSLDYVSLLMPQPGAITSAAADSELPGWLAAAVAPILGIDPGAETPLREDDLAIMRVIAEAIRMGTTREQAIRIFRSLAQGVARLVALQRDFVDEVLLGPAIRETGSPITALASTSEDRYRYREMGRLLVGLLMGRLTEDAILRNLIDLTESALTAGGIDRPAPKDTIVFLDVSGYTRLSEEHGDSQAAHQATLLADFTHDLAAERGARLVRSLGDGALLFAPDPETAVPLALDAVAGARPAGIWPLHGGINTGPTVRIGGDFFGTTVNVASRVADEATVDEVVVTGSVVSRWEGSGIDFLPLGERGLRNVNEPVALFRAVAAAG